MSSSDSSTASASVFSSEEEKDLLERIRRLRLPLPPDATADIQEDDTVAHLASGPRLVVPTAAPAPPVAPAVPTVPARPTLPVAVSESGLPAVAAQPSVQLPLPSPSVTTTVMPVEATQIAPQRSQSESRGSARTAPSLDDTMPASPSAAAARASLPTSPLASPAVEAPPVPSVPSVPMPPLAPEASVPAVSPIGTRTISASPIAPAVPSAAASRPPPLTVTVLTSAPPGSCYPAVADTTLAAAASAAAVPDTPIGATRDPASRAVDVVEVKRQKKPLEGRDRRLFPDSPSDTSLDGDVRGSTPADDLLAFLGNVVSTAEVPSSAGASSPQPAAIARIREEERKKRRKRLDQEQAQPALVIRQTDVQQLGKAESDTQEKDLTARTAEPSLSSQSTNALTPDQKVKLLGNSPGTSQEPTPEKDDDNAVQKEQPDRRTHRRHRRAHDDLRDAVDDTYVEGLSSPGKGSLRRHMRTPRKGELDTTYNENDIVVTQPGHITEAAHKLSGRLTDALGVPPSTFVTRLGNTYVDAEGGLPWRSTFLDEADAANRRLSETAELTRQGFCKSGAFEDEAMSTRRSASHGMLPLEMLTELPLPECLYVTIRGMSPMHADVNVVHPFVRVWLVNCRTGENLLSSRHGAPFGITQLFDLRQRQSRAPLWDAEVALPLNLAAVSKSPKEAVLLVEVLDICTETITGEFVPRTGVYPICWGFYYLYDRYGNLNFGVGSDATPSSDRGGPGRSSTTVHLQMFRFPLRAPWYAHLFSGLLPASWSSTAVWAPFDYLSSGGVLQRGLVPDADPSSHGAAVGEDPAERRDAASVLSRGMLLGLFAIFHFMRNRKVPYKAGMAVSMRFVQDEASVRPRVAKATDYEEHLMRQLAAMAGNCIVPRLHDTARGISTRVSPNDGPLRVPVPRRLAEEAQYHRLSLCVVDTDALEQNYERVGTTERCLPPTHTLQTCPVPGAVTCMSFSQAGTLMALGVTRHLQYLVELRLPLLADFSVAARMSAHTGHIYHVAFNGDDTKLLSCASDHTVRVWMGTDGYNFADVSPQRRTLSVSCVCVLPHRWPLYTAVFHSFHLHRRRHMTDEYIITGGYSHKIVAWKLSDAPHSLNSTGLLTVPGESFRSPARSVAECDGRQACELVCRVALAENAFTLQIASTDGTNRVWSVDSTGTVICWRTTVEADGFEMSVRMRSPDLACTRIVVSPSTVVALKPHSPTVFLFDATSGKPLRHKPPPLAADCAAFTALPDGSGFVGGTANGRLRCWNWETSTLFACTAPHGYRSVEVQYPIDQIAWASREHLVATASPAPCPDYYLNNVLLPQLRPLDNPGAVELPPFDLSQLEVTLITVSGAPQPTTSGPPPSVRLVDFVRLFGGDAAALQQARAGRSGREVPAGPHTSVRIERFDEDVDEDPSTVLSRAMAQVDAQLNSIVQFWRRAFAGSAQTQPTSGAVTAAPASSSREHYRDADLEL